MGNLNSNPDRKYFEPTAGDLLLREGSDGPISTSVKGLIVKAQSNIFKKSVSISNLIEEVRNTENQKIKITQKKLQNDVSGYIKKSSNGSYVIGVNKNHHIVRQRFTAAHELAHFFLHREQIGDGIEEDALLRSDSMGGQREWQANSLAAAILMPFWLMERITGVEGLFAVEAIAKVCKVSEPAARVRLNSYVDAVN